jgi:glycosyltransferase involved in cell wall biosynthesis
MKVLLCNTYLYRRGGAEVSLFDLADLLTTKGHAVIFFGMKDPKNEVKDNSEYFVDNLEFDDYRPTRFLWGVKAVGRVMYSTQAMQRVRKLVRDERPDLVYVNNIAHHISPSILEVFKEFDLPVALSVRDYKIVCPNSLLLNRTSICERCIGGRFYNAVLYRCKRNSLIPSAVACAEAYLHRLRRLYSLVDVLLAPSIFCKKKLVQFGLDEERIRVVPNFVNTDGFTPPAPATKPFCVYFGRLSHEKGLFELVGSAAHTKSALVVIGDGGLMPELVRYAKDLGAENVRFMGRLERRELFRVVGSSMFTVFPSLCYETFGRGVLESFSLGKPVLVSRGGALEELVHEGVDGLVADPRDPHDLNQKLEYMFSSAEVASRMGEMGRAKVMKGFTPEHHYKKLMSALEKILGPLSS